MIIIPRKESTSERSFFLNSDSLDSHDFVDVFIVSCHCVISCLAQGVEALLAVLRPGCEKTFFFNKRRYKDDMKIDSQFDINLISLNKRMLYANLRTICSQK